MVEVDTGSGWAEIQDNRNEPRPVVDTLIGGLYAIVFFEPTWLLSIIG